MERQSMVLTVHHQLIAAVASAQRIGARQVLEAMCEMETFTVYPKWFNEASTCDADTPRSSERLPPVFVPHFTRRLNLVLWKDSTTIAACHSNSSPGNRSSSSNLQQYTLLTTLCFKSSLENVTRLDPARTQAMGWDTYLLCTSGRL